MKKLFILFVTIGVFFSCEMFPTEEKQSSESPGIVELKKVLPDINLGDYSIPDLFEIEFYQGDVGTFGNGTTRSLHPAEAQMNANLYEIVIYNDQWRSSVYSSDPVELMSGQVVLPPGNYRAILLVGNAVNQQVLLLGSTPAVNFTITAGNTTLVDLHEIVIPFLEIFTPPVLIRGGDPHIEVHLLGHLYNPNLYLAPMFSTPEARGPSVGVDACALDISGFVDEASYYAANTIWHPDGSWNFFYRGIWDETLSFDPYVTASAFGGEIIILDQDLNIYIPSFLISEARSWYNYGPDILLQPFAIDDVTRIIPVY